MGFSIGASQCLVAPPYALAAIVMYATGWAGDKYHVRGPIIVFNMILCIIGISIMGFAKSPAVRYFGKWHWCTNECQWHVLTVVRCFLNHSWSKQQRTGGHVIPGQQHPRTVETCLLLSDTRWYGRCRRYCRRTDLQVRQTW
jgi:hypothetical protein